MTPPNLTDVQRWGETIQLIIEIAGTAAFALSGVLEGAQKKLDAVGICVVGFLAAFGGGTLRDLLLDARPFFWVRHVELLWGVLALCLLSMLVLRRHHFALTQRAIEGPDALGLGLFTASGAHMGLLSGNPALVAVLMGVITGVFGGVLRDIVCNEVPAAFSDHRPYAVCAFAGGWVYVLLEHWGAPQGLSLLTCVVVTAGLRGLAVWRGWTLPAWRMDS
ncbi:MAG: hypothetical protein OHK0048_08430 [Rhodoferax sp.]